MSDESPGDAGEAPAAVPAQGAAPVAEPGVEAAGDQPVVSGEADAGAEVDIASLPPAAQEYIRQLREEAKDRRIKHDPYEKAFEHFNAAEQEYLLNMVDTLGVNQEVGAKAMQTLSNQILGIKQEAESVESDPVVQEEAAAAGLTPAEVQEMIRKEREQEIAIAGVEAETRALGFEPGTPESIKLWDLAYALEETDLSKVAPLVHEYFGTKPASAEGEAAAAPDPVPAPEFPVTAGINVGVGDSNAGEVTAAPKLDSPEMRERVRRRIEQAAQPG